jgi:hypothetical protein
MRSAFGVDHGYVVSKKKEDWTTASSATGGRYAGGVLFPGFHGAIAGKKGKKLKAVGHEVLPTMAGNAIAPGVGGVVGAGAGVNAAQNKGYYKGSKAKKHAKSTVH